MRLLHGKLKYQSGLIRGFIYAACVGLLILSLVGSQPSYGSISDIKCLALNDYHEARSESLVARISIASVVLNRAVTGTSICKVLRVPNQFSWVYGVYDKTPYDTKQWEMSKRIATAMLDPEQKIKDPTYGALYYHHVDVTPEWTKEMTTYITIGKHKFYFEVKEYP